MHKGLENKLVIWDNYYKGYINIMINAVIEFSNDLK
jgi:hypothetical protein